VRPVLAFPLLALAAAAAGCGGSKAAAPAAPAERLTAPARPAASPAPARRPAGKVLRVGALPDAIAADPNAHQFAVAVHDPGRLALVDSATGRLQRHVAVPIGDPTRRVIPPAVFLVPAETGRRALAVAPADHTAPATPPVASALVLGRTFVASAGGVDVLDGGRPTTRLPGPIAPGGIASATFDTSLAVVDARRDTVALYDARTLRRTGLAAAGAGPTNVVALGDLLFVADTRGNAVLTYSTRPRLRRIGRLAFPGASPYGLAVDPVRRRLLVTLTARNQLATVDVTRVPNTVTTRPTIRQPGAVAIDSANGTIAVAGRTGGALQLITAELRRAVLRQTARSAG
jgi:DNA-binding beta-propeller fold protein YncE